MTPTQRTLAKLREEGWTVQVVERFCPFSKRRIDLFGIIDIVAVGKGSILGVQCTSGNGGNHAARRDKALAEPRLRTWLEGGGRFTLMSWAKRGAKGERKLWTCRCEDITLSDLPSDERSVG